MSKLNDWHEKDDGEIGKALVEACEQACKDNMPRAADAAVFAQLVDGRLSGIIGASGDGSPYHGLVAATPVYRNDARSVYETGNAKVAGLSDDLPQLVSSGGDYRHQQGAIKLTRWLDALYASRHGKFADFGALGRQAFAVAQVTGTVFMFPETYPDGRIEGHLDNGLSVGIQRSGPNGRIVSMVRTRPRARCEAIELYGEEFKEAIIKAPCHRSPGSLAHRDAEKRDEVAIYEGWRMANSGEPGFWVHCLADGTILDEGDYDYDDEPCSAFHCYEPIDGEWGIPMVRHVIDACLAANRSLTDYIDAVDIATTLLAITDNDEVHKKLGALPKVAAIKVKRVGDLQFQAPQVSEQSANLANMLRTAAFETTGISEAAASSKRLGGTSGIHDHYIASLNSERLSYQGRALTTFRAVSSAKKFIRAGQMAAERYPKATVFYKAKGESEELKLADLDLDGADRFVLRVAATDEQRDTPKARREMAREMLDAGRISPTEYFQVSATFDVDALQDRLSIHREALDKQIQRWLSVPDTELNGSFEDLVDEPTPFVGKDVLRDLIARAADAHTDARMRKANPRRIRLFEHFLEVAAEQLKSILTEEAALNAPPPAPPAAAPPGGTPV